MLCFIDSHRPADITYGQQTGLFKQSLNCVFGPVRDLWGYPRDVSF